MDELTEDFVQAIERMSYYNAAEGPMYRKEIHERNKAYKTLEHLKQEMISVHGVEFTKQVIENTPNLCWGELKL